MEDKIIEKVIEFVENLRKSGHNVETEDVLLKSLGVELSPEERGVLFRALETCGTFRPDDGICLDFEGLNLSALPEVAKSIKPTTESTAEVEKEADPVDPSTFKLNGTWIVTTDANGKRHHHFQRDKPFVHSNKDENQFLVQKVRDESDGQSHLIFDL